MKIKYVGGIVAAVVALISWSISTVSSYDSMKTEWLFVVMFIIVAAVIGGFIGELFRPKNKFNEDLKNDE